MKLNKRTTTASIASKPSIMSFGMLFLVVWMIGVAMTMPTCDAAKTVQSQATKGVGAMQSKTKSKIGPTVPRRVGVKPSSPATTKIFRFSSQQSATVQQEVLQQQQQQQQNEQKETLLTSASSPMPVDGSINEGASVPNMVFNLVKCIVGAGVLGLPSGAAAVSGPGGLWKANILTIVIGAMSAYGFATIGKVCAMTGTTSYKEAWGKTVGESTSFLPVISCLLVTICSVLAYSMVLADTIPNLLQLVGVTISRTRALFTVTLTALLPLCLLKSLKALAPFSLVGITGMIWTTVAMAIRYFDKSYTVGGALYDAVPPQLRPSSAVTVGPWTNAFVLVSMLSTASMAHYNAPKFYTELQNRTLPRYYTVVGTSVVFSVTIFSVVMTLGYLTFGQSCSGLILNNYAPQDKLMSVGRICVAVSLLCSYPLTFTGVRDGILDLANVKDEKRTDGLLNAVTVTLLTGVTGLALVIRDLRVLLAFGGATWGNFVTYLFPICMLLSLAKKNSAKVSTRELPIAWTVLVAGLVMSAIGTQRALQMR